MARTSSFVVRLKEEDDRRLRYIAEKTGVGVSTTVVRMLIRAASEGRFTAGALQFNFEPYSSLPPSAKEGAK
jgi:hypothetical protein